MSGLTFVMLAIVAMLSLGAQPTPQPKPAPKPQPKPSPAKVVEVEIIVATLDEHQKSCKAGGLSPTTVLVSGKQVHHCVKSLLLDHDVDELKNPDFKLTVVHVSAGESIRWFSKATTFRVAQVRLHEPIQKGAPPYPFLDSMPNTFTNEVRSSPVRNEPGDIVQQYKVSFEIGKPGDKQGIRVDPDVVCSM